MSEKDTEKIATWIVSEEQLRLIAKIVIGLCHLADVYAPYNAWGLNVSQCRFCGVIGEMRYPDVFYDHKNEVLKYE